MDLLRGHELNQVRQELDLGVGRLGPVDGPRVLDLLVDEGLDAEPGLLQHLGNFGADLSRHEGVTLDGNFGRRVAFGLDFQLENKKKLTYA